MKIYIVRHGETNENKQTKLMGRSPGKLSDNGKQQAEKTGVILLKEKIDLIYSSPLARCFDTAQIINKSLKKEIIKNELLIERDFGKLTNTTADNIDFEALDEPTEENIGLCVEPLSSVKIRMEEFLDKIKKKHINKNLVLVCHNNPIRMILAVLLNTTYHNILNKYKIHNCGITIFDISEDGKINLVKIDDVEHLN